MRKQIGFLIASLILAGVAPISASEKTEEKMPFSDEECFAVKTGKYSIALLDQDGTVIKQFENAKFADQAGMNIYEDARILKRSEPLAVFIKTGEEEYDFKAGIYSISKEQWLVEPVYNSMRLIGNGLCTDSDVLSGGGSLIRLDGTVLSSNVDGVLQEEGEFICSGSQIFDLDGALLGNMDGYQYLEGDQIWFTRDGQTLQMDVHGTILQTEASGLTLMHGSHERLSWVDANGAGLITDLSLNRIMDDAQFYEINAGKLTNENGMQLISMNESGSRQLISMNEPDDTGFINSHYYLCDEDYRIIEDYPLNHLTYYSWKDEGSIWSWSSEDYQHFEMEKPLTEDKVELDIPGLSETTVISTYEEGPVLVVSGFGEDGIQRSVCVINDVPMPQIFENTSIEVLDQKVIAMYHYQTNSSEYNREFYRMDGSFLCGGEGTDVLYADENLRCVRQGSYICMENSKGELFCKLQGEKDESI